MYASLLIVLAVAVGAPGVKDPPKKEASIVGVWIREKLTAGGKDESELGAGARFTFTEDGKFLMKQKDRDEREEGKYKVDPKKDPAEIEFEGRRGKKDSPILGIYKLDGDSLTLCINGGENARPTKFESPEGSQNILMTFKRAKKE